MAETTAYVPGVCNINRAEIAYRRKAGYFGLVVLIALAGIMFLLGLSRWYRIILFIPAFIAAIGYFQVKNKFCVSYAASGQQNATDGSSAAQKITDDAAHRKDKQKARGMNIKAGLIAAVVTIVLVVV